MPKFLKIATQMFPAERIEKIDRQANISGALGVEVKLHGIPETFCYTGEYASLAYDVLEGTEAVPAPPVPDPRNIVLTIDGAPVPFLSVLTAQEEIAGSVLLKGQPVKLNDIEWVDFNSNINGQPGIEVRVAIDAPGVTRQYTGQDASDVYDVLAALAFNQDEAAAAN